MYYRVAWTCTASQSTAILRSLRSEFRVAEKLKHQGGFWRRNINRKNSRRVQKSVYKFNLHPWISHEIGMQEDYQSSLQIAMGGRLKELHRVQTCGAVG